MCWLNITTFKRCSEILHQLPVVHGGLDQILWHAGTSPPTVASIFRLLASPGPKVGWSSLLLGPFKISRHTFLLWLAILDRLSTFDKPWLSHLDASCILCADDAMETHSHLFFRCLYSRHCLAEIRHHVWVPWPNRSCTTDATWAST
ncbi:UNVERIFIED_CONTAM: hypothetical protein Sindi_0968300 [Sesamum indicum]